MDLQKNYRLILSEEYRYRFEQNRRYSMRAFARDLGLAPSQLSEVFSGKIGLSAKKAEQVAYRLGLRERELNYFVALVCLEHGRGEKSKQDARKFLEKESLDNQFYCLSEDQLQFLSQWYYYAILSTMELDHYDGSSLFIGRHLSLEQSVLDQAMKTLLRLDLINIDQGKFILSGKMLTTTYDQHSIALKKFHRDHLRKSIESIDASDVKNRDISTMTMAIDIKKLGEAKKRIQDFRRSLCQFLEDGEKNHVFNLNIQLFPFSNHTLIDKEPLISGKIQ